MPDRTSSTVTALPSEREIVAFDPTPDPQTSLVPLPTWSDTETSFVPSVAWASRLKSMPNGSFQSVRAPWTSASTAPPAVFANETPRFAENDCSGSPESGTVIVTVGDSTETFTLDSPAMYWIPNFQSPENVTQSGSQ